MRHWSLLAISAAALLAAPDAPLATAEVSPVPVNAAGEPVAAMRDEPHPEDYLYVTGKKFYWPAPKVGAKMKVPGLMSPVPGAGEIEIEVLSVWPRVFRVNNFLSHAESEVLKKWAVDHRNQHSMRPSTVGAQSWTQKGGKTSKSSSRTSENAWDVNSPVAMPIKRRAFELLRLKYNESMADGVQILRYENGQHYQVHTDFFGVNSYTTEGSHNFDSGTPGGTNRLATIFMYLSDVEAGGETYFDKGLKPKDPQIDDKTASLIEKLTKENPRAGALAKQCAEGFSVRPKKGSAILFYSQDEGGNLDPLASHAGCPVLEGQKWAANMWVWNGCRYGLKCDLPPNEPYPPYPDYFDDVLAAPKITNDAAATAKKPKKKKKKKRRAASSEEL